MVRYRLLLTRLGQPREKRRLGYLVLALLAVFNSWLLFVYHLPGHTLFWYTLQDAGHGLIFLTLSLALCVCFHLLFSIPPTRVVLWVFGVCLAFGGGAELVQALVGRSPSWGDFWLDVLGTSAGLSLYLSSLSNGPVRWICLLLAFALMWIDLSTPLRVHWAENQRQKQFPVLADFDNRWLNGFVRAADTARWQTVPAPVAWRGHDSIVARLDQFPGDWPGLHLFEVEPDWSNYTVFSFDVFNPSQTVARVTVRISDIAHNHMYPDRFNRMYKFKPGAQHIEISLDKVRSAPRTREMDLTRMKAVIIYTYRLNEERTLYFDNIQLR